MHIKVFYFREEEFARTDRNFVKLNILSFYEFTRNKKKVVNSIFSHVTNNSNNDGDDDDDDDYYYYEKFSRKKDL